METWLQSAIGYIFSLFLFLNTAEVKVQSFPKLETWNWGAWSGFKTEKAVACGNVHQVSETAKGDIDAYEPLVTHYMQYTAGEARGLKQRSTKAMCLFWLFPWSDLLPPSIPHTRSHKRYTGNNYGSWSGIQRKKVMTRRDLVKGAGETE